MNFIETVLSEIKKDYTTVICGVIRENTEKETLSDINPFCCRFCGKSSTQDQFKNIAHVIPEFMGNKKLFSNYECDNCNSYFSQFETHMANYMLSFNTLSGTKSKNNRVPKYKLKGQPIIENTPDQIFVTELSDINLCDLDNNVLSIPTKIPSYIPEYLYRCLVKIAVSILPESNLVNYRETINWLMNVDIESNIKPFMIFSLYPFRYKMNEILTVVLERKDDCRKMVPYSLFFLAYKNFGFQICIPCTSKEIIEKELNAIPFIFPTSLDLNENCRKERNNNIIDLSSRQKKTDDFVKYTVTGEHFEIKNTTAT